MPTTIYVKEKQDVVKEKDAARLWLKSEQFCMVKSLTSKLHLKQSLYSHRLIEGNFLEDHLSVFKKLVVDLEIIEVKYDEDLRSIFLCSLPPSYVSFRNTIFYSGDTLTIDEIYDAFYFKKNMKYLVVRSQA